MDLEDNWKTLKMASLGSMLSSRLKGCLPQVGPNMSLHPLRHFAISSMRRQRVLMILWLFDVIWYHLGNFWGLNHLILSDFQDIVMGIFMYFPTFWSLQPKNRCFERDARSARRQSVIRTPWKARSGRPGTQRLPVATSERSSDLRASLQHRLKVASAASTSRRRSMGLSSEKPVLSALGLLGLESSENGLLVFQIFPMRIRAKKRFLKQVERSKMKLVEQRPLLFLGDAKSCEDNRMT